MNRADRIIAHLQNIATYCPICGLRLIQITRGTKRCRKCYGDLRAESGPYGPHIVFDVPQEVYDQAA